MNVHRVLLAVVLLAVSVAAAAARAETTWTVGVVPQFPAEQIFRTWTPVLQALSARTGARFSLRTFNSIPDFEAAFARGELDIAYMNPYHAVMANEAEGYIPIVRDGERRLSGILVVRRDSGVTDVGQLDGATIAFPAPNAFGASLYMRALLAEQEGITIQPEYVRTHSNVYRHVVTGRARAGGGVRRTLEREPAGLQAQLQVLYETPKTFPHPVAVHPRVPGELRSAIQAALVDLGSDPDGRALMQAVQMPSPTAATYADYADLAALGLARFVVVSN